MDDAEVVDSPSGNSSAAGSPPAETLSSSSSPSGGTSVAGDGFASYRSSRRASGSSAKLEGSAAATTAPLSIRSLSHSSLSSSFAATLDAPLKTPKVERSIKFRPNLTSASTSSTRNSSHLSTPNSASAFDIGSMLAHSLQIKYQADQGRGDKEPLRRGFSGPLGARRGGGTRMQPSSGASNLQIHNRIKQKMQKEEGNGRRSKHLMELSWADDKAEDLSYYLPLSLPYVLRDTDEGTAQEATISAAATGKSRRPRAKLVDEANRNAAALFTTTTADNAIGSNSDDDERDWFLIQMPSILPPISKAAMDRQREALDSGNAKSGDGPSPTAAASPIRTANRRAEKRLSAAVEDEEEQALSAPPTVLSALPEGRLGKLRIHQSGRVRLWISGHAFDINQGSECNFAQDAGALVGNNSEFMFLGPCTKRVTVVPDIERMIQITKPAFMERA